MRPLNVRQLEAFRAVMLAGGLTAGARLLSVSQPAVSRLIRDLEAVLEVPLFQRGAGRLRPTLEAGRLYAAVERSFESMRDVAEVAAGLRASRLLQLRIATAPTLAMTLIPPLIGALLKQHPKTSVRIVTTSAIEVTAMLSRAEVDLGIAAVAPDRPGVESELLPPLATMCALPHGHALAGKPAIEPADLHDLDFIAIGGEGIFQVRVQQALAMAGAVPRTRLLAPSSATAIQYVAQGIGSALIDPFASRLADGDSVVVRPFAPVLPYELAVFRPTGTARSPLAERFVALLKEALASR